MHNHAPTSAVSEAFAIRQHTTVNVMRDTGAPTVLELIALLVPHGLMSLLPTTRLMHQEWSVLIVGFVTIPLVSAANDIMQLMMA